MDYVGKKCDVYGTLADVKSFRLEIREQDGSSPDGTPPKVLGTVDLSPRALKRLAGFIQRGLTSPHRNSKTEPAK